MNELAAQLRGFAAAIESVCSHVSVREDENGPYIFALGLKGTHTLQLRRLDDRFVVQLWHGKTAEVERVVREPHFSSAMEAFHAAKSWLENDLS